MIGVAVISSQDFSRLSLPPGESCYFSVVYIRCYVFVRYCWMSIFVFTFVIGATDFSLVQRIYHMCYLTANQLSSVLASTLLPQ